MNLHSQLATIQKICSKVIWHFAYKTVFTKLSKDDTYFQPQYDSCICIESVIVQLRFHQIWPHWYLFMVQELLDKI